MFVSFIVFFQLYSNFIVIQHQCCSTAWNWKPCCSDCEALRMCLWFVTAIATEYTSNSSYAQLSNDRVVWSRSICSRLLHTPWRWRPGLASVFQCGLLYRGLGSWAWCCDWNQWQWPGLCEQIFSCLLAYALYIKLIIEACLAFEESHIIMLSGFVKMERCLRLSYQK